MAISYQFLPWVRRGLTVALDTVDNLGNLPAHAEAHVGVTLAAPLAGEAIAPLAVRLHGPGDVIAIDTSLVVRTDPRPNTTNFEPNYCAIIDFDPPDFPWMLTPARANADHRLRPWLVLVVLDVAKTGTPKMQGPGPLPSVRINAADVNSELPPLNESWSWAHAQVVSQSAAQDLAGIQHDLQGYPSSNISRLICPRRLQPDRNYVACVVPAFEPGRLRGLGLAGDGSSAAMQTLTSAWSKPSGADVVLPVYYHWEFSTGPAGDFEYLARRLRSPKKWKNDPAIAAQLANVGTAPMAIDTLIGGGLSSMEGALVPISYQPGASSSPTHAGSLAAIVNTPASQVDNPVVDEADGSVRRIEVKPPLYGGWHAKQHSAVQAQQASYWLAGLNLNPRYRGAAGYGAEVVRKNQEDYVDACWDQIGEIRAAEMKFNLTRLAIEAMRALKAKHFDPLPNERLLQLMGPALPRIEALTAQGAAAFKVNGALASLGGQIDRSSLPAALVDSALRRGLSPLRRNLRSAARRTQFAAQLPALGGQYLKQMAAASSKAAVFAVNEFVPDGILGTRLFDGLTLNGDAGKLFDLADRGLSKQPTLGQIKGLLAATAVAQRSFASKGVPPPMIRVGQSKGVFTDAHMQRFGALLSASTGTRSADLGVMTEQVEALGRRGVEGFLVEAQRGGAQLQFSAMQLDKRNGALRLDRPLLRFNAQRRAIPASRADVSRAAGITLGNVQLATVRSFGNVALFANLPPNAIDLQAGAIPGSFVLSPGLEFSQVGDAAPPRDVVSITLPPALRERAVLNRFSVATRGIQSLWREPFETMRVAVQTIDFGVAQAAQIVRARTQPELTLSARLASQVSIAQAAFGQKNAYVSAYLTANAADKLRYMVPALFDRVMAWPHLREPMYSALAAYNQEAFMPGVGNLPQDLIMLVQVNQYFIDSFMVGANVEMNGELLWRGFPTDLRGTPFQRFWGRVKARSDGSIESLDDMLPIHQWLKQALGKRSDPNITDPDRVALLIKGQLLRRYPNSAVYAWKRKKNVPADQSKLVKNAQGLPPNPETDIQTPVFAGVLSPDVTFFGFDIDKADIGDWCFVIEEHMGEPRFGFDVTDPAPGATQPIGATRRASLSAALVDYARGAAASPQFLAVRNAGFNPYKALTWAHLGVAEGAFASVAAISSVPNKPFASFPTLTDTPTAAEIAGALLQLPFRAYWEGPDLAT
ncbi:MAG: hypothetical protein ABI564_03575 [Ideonella sp.]